MISYIQVDSGKPTSSLLTPETALNISIDFLSGMTEMQILLQQLQN